jgi:hypothetical protein
MNQSHRGERDSGEAALGARASREGMGSEPPMPKTGVRMARRHERFLPALVIAVSVLTLGGIAGARVPDAGGVIHACYSSSLGTMRVIDTEIMPQRGCRAQEQALEWNAKGRDGEQGPPGPVGPAGEQGPPGPGTTAYSTVVPSGQPLPSGVETRLSFLILPAGNYVISGNIDVLNPSDRNDLVFCRLQGPGIVDVATVSLAPQGEPGTVATLPFLLQASWSSSDNVVSLVCVSNGGSALTPSAGRLVATQIATLVEQPGPHPPGTAPPTATPSPTA